MQKTLTKTSAEEALAAQFKALAAKLPGGPRVQAARVKAMAAFEAQGLPHRRIESWKYTDLRSKWTAIGSIATGDTTPVTKAQLDAALGSLAALDADRIVFVNGTLRPSLSAATPVIGTTVGHVVGTMDGEDAVTVPSALGHEGIAALNAALVTDGAVIAANRALQKPVLIVAVTAGDQPQLVSLSHKISVDVGVSATVIEAHVTLPGAKSTQSNSVVQVILHDGAALTHMVVVQEGAAATHLASVSASLGAGATYCAFQFTANTSLVRNQSFVRFNGEGGKIDISGLMLGRGKDHIDTTLVIDHAVPGCESRELFKTVLDDTARAIFQGKVIVRQDAQKTDGKQMANALMLSEACEFDSKPELEIYADDVVCGHGATVAEIDPKQLFYLRSRGIPKDEARAMLIESFAGEALERVEDESIRAALQTMASDWFAAKRV